MIIVNKMSTSAYKPNHTTTLRKKVTNSIKITQEVVKLHRNGLWDLKTLEVAKTTDKNL